jgi:ATP-dependent DNA ligase
MLIDMLDGWAKKNLSKNIPPINVIPYEIVNSEKEARDFYKKMRNSGFEGAILKDFSEKWKPTTSNKFIKLKNRAEAEFEIVDAYYGTEGKRNSDILGGLTVKSSDGKIVTNVGTGFTEEDRKHGVDWWKSHIGDIVTLSFESVISEKTGRKTFKLFLPSFEDTRFTEKIEADTLEYCQSLGYQ